MPPGLRERKRLATRRAIQRAALTVVQEQGLEAATVDEISRVAGVSPRTFFNYFPAKEDALLGEPPTLAGNEAAEWFVQDRGAILDGLCRLIIAGSAEVTSDPELVSQRRTIGKRYPEIGARRLANLHHFEQELTELVTRRLGAEYPDMSESDVADRSRLLALTAFAFARHAWFRWIDQTEGTRDLTELVAESFERGRLLVKSSERLVVG